MDALNAAWATAHPAASAPLVAFSINDDGMMIWLNDRSDAATSFAKNFLLNQSGAATTSTAIRRLTHGSRRLRSPDHLRLLGLNPLKQRLGVVVGRAGFEPAKLSRVVY